MGIVISIYKKLIKTFNRIGRFALFSSQTRRGLIYFIIFLLIIFYFRAPTVLCCGQSGFVGKDVGVFAYVADSITKGKIPYKDLWDFKPPLTYYLFASIFELFKSHYVIIARFEIIWLFASCATFFFLSRKLFDEKASFLITFLFTIYASSISMAESIGMTETYMLLPYLASTYFIFRYRDKPKIIDIFLAGLMAGFAFLFKQTGVVVVALGFIIVVYKHVIQKREFSKLITRNIFLGAGLLLPIIAFLIYFWVNGALGDFVSQVIIYPQVYKQGFFFPIKDYFDKLYLETTKVAIWRWPLLLNISVIGFIAGLLRLIIQFRRGVKGKIIDFVVICVWLVLSIIAISASGVYYGHYYVQAIPALALLSGYIFNKLDNGTYFILAVIVLYYAQRYSPIIIQKKALNDTLFNKTFNSKTYYVNRAHKVKKWVENNSDMTDMVYFWGSETGLNFEIQREIPTKYIYLSPIETPGYTKQADIDRFIDDIRMKRPKYIIDTAKSSVLAPSLKDPYKRKRYYQTYSDLLLSAREFIKNHYHLVETIDSWDIYEINSNLIN